MNIRFKLYVIAKLDRLLKITYGPNEVETFRYDTWGKLISSTKNRKSATDMQRILHRFLPQYKLDVLQLGCKSIMAKQVE